ncbi:DUF6461 domain-containing protein [Actinoplanes aureus]|uniref:Uncharacterized protein n=1 Tax=Actinoplanes aureus TaxID=2792083 RepID=A0A931C4V0_9ACTN|nr:DUF6461 domain-containing protein [Actinoplanes aureus]MBG0562264.1 hypothetical protein [Actinoplanes aureus]
MICTADRYAWFPARYARLSRSYCLTLVADLPVPEVVRRLGGRDPVEMPGLAVVHDNAEKIAAGLPLELARTTGELPREYAGFAGRLAHEHLVAIAPVNGWTLLVETRDFAGVDPDRAARLSRGVTLVAHSASAAGRRFLWMYDGTMRLTFDPGDPASPEGPEREVQRPILAEAGFPGTGPGPALAYADYLTGVRFDPETLVDAFYLCVTAP